jgi:hypothetical protein
MKYALLREACVQRIDSCEITSRSVHGAQSFVALGPAREIGTSSQSNAQRAIPFAEHSLRRIPGVVPGVRVSGTLPQRGSLCSPGAGVTDREDMVATERHQPSTINLS